MSQAPIPPENSGQTRRDIRTAVRFGIIAATVELAVLLYFMFG